MAAVAVNSPPGHADPPPEGRKRPPGRRRIIPWAVLALWIAVLAAAVPLAGQLEDAQRDESVSYLPDSADSTRVVRLQEALPGGEATELLIVFSRDGGLTDADRRAAAERVAAIAGAHDPAGGAPRGVPSEDGGTELYPLTLTGLDEEEQAAAVEDVRALAAEGLPEGLTAQVGGPGALQYDQEEVFGSVDATLMLATVAVVAILLILTYRSPVLWLLPLLSVGVATVCAQAVVYALVQAFDLTVTTMAASVMTVLIFGAGTDYALLLVARYREELRRHPHPLDAMLRALRGCGPALLASSGTVAAGLICLLAADDNSASGLGPVGAVGILCSLLVMTTLLPALLVMCGRRVFWPLIPAHGSEPRAGRGWFGRMGASVSRRPVAILAGGVVLLGALSLGALALPGQLKSEDSFRDTPESVQAMERLTDAFPERNAQPILVMARDAAVPEVVAAAESTAGVADAEPARSGGGWTEIAVHATDPPESEGEEAAIEALRDRLAAVPGADAAVGGPTAQQMDLGETSRNDRMLVIPLVLGVVLLILIALLRGALAPAILLAAVVASWGAALGLAGLVFGPVLGLEGLDPSVPLLTFVFGVALGVDYGIFLMHRMREEALGGLPTRQAALTALRTTGGVIASAGLVLAATFTVLMTLPVVTLTEIGFVVAVGVLLDTFLVRTYIVTAASWLLGRRVWWPGPLSRRPEPAETSPAPAAGDGR
ncbi:MMPL family transporter [Streptomyces sp. DSM 44917]|uniref:MMPL family transporter n=1 Tax=Streptomyces boetiae TaxID=3075541 RepID=A0ABU2LAK7_9ACTN|nr:MMPL family transporter [Streptomyces sp. DSM 44917]MDT0308599.1 MMPL family transporter [Streptomyces sp. DSM 44917]